jgi:ABC-2 type transport system ATP-binding protein
VRSRDTERLAALLREQGIAVEPDGAGTLLAPGTQPEVVGQVAARHQIVLSELGILSRSLEDAFLELTEDQP